MKDTVKCEIVEKEPCTTRETRVINGISFTVIKRFYYNEKLEKHCCRVTVKVKAGSNGFMPCSFIHYDFDNETWKKNGKYRERSYFFMNDSLLFLQNDVFMFLYEFFKRVEFIISVNRDHKTGFTQEDYFTIDNIKIRVMKEYFYDMDIEKHSCKVTAFIKAHAATEFIPFDIGYNEIFFNDILSVNWGLYRGGYRRSSWIINDKDINKLTDKVERYIKRQLEKIEKLREGAGKNEKNDVCFQSR